MWSRVAASAWGGSTRLVRHSSSSPSFPGLSLQLQSHQSVQNPRIGSAALGSAMGVTAVLDPVAILATSASNAASGAFKRKQEKKVGTHNGTFHCDEALGCFMIRLTEKFAGCDIVRTRDQRVLDTLDAVLDVGGVYEPDRDRYDHHQRGFDSVFGHGFTTKLSSAGLVYKHFGEEIVGKELGKDPQDPDVQRVYLAVYKSFMEAIDGIDNGVNQYDTDQPPKYVEGTHLSARVGRLNPDWMDEQTAEKEDQAFSKAMSLTGKEFLDIGNEEVDRRLSFYKLVKLTPMGGIPQSVHFYGKSWLPARSIVAESLAARHEVHESGEIMILKSFCPTSLALTECVTKVYKWKQHLFEIEQELDLNPTIKYVVYQDERSGQWRVQAVAVAPGKFESRKALPVQWCGLRDEELSKEAGIDGCVFVHMSGFIGGAKTLDGTLELARKALSVMDSV